MALENRTRLQQLALSAFGVACFVTLIAYAADGQFAGRWKGELNPAAPQARGSAPTGGPVSGPGAGATGGTTTGAAAAAGPAPTAAPAAPPAGGGGAGGGARGGFGGGFGGVQKVSLNLKQSKDNKVSGNIMYGEQQADDVKDGRATGNTLTFKAGKTPQIYEYVGEIKGEELILTRNSSDGRGRPQEIVLSKK